MTLIPLPLTANISDSLAPMGVCDDCGRAVTEAGRYLIVDLTADQGAKYKAGDQAAQVFVGIVAGYMHVSRCRTCGMSRPLRRP